MEKLFEPIKDIIQRLTSAREFKPLFAAKGVKIHNIIAKSPEDIFSTLYQFAKSRHTNFNEESKTSQKLKVSKNSWTMSYIETSAEEKAIIQIELHEIEKDAHKYAISLLRVDGSAQVFDQAATAMSTEIFTH